MAEESQDGQEKTEDPSQRKIDKSKEDGQILQSKEMFVFTSIAMGMLIFLFISFLEYLYFWSILKMKTVDIF